MPGLRLGLGTGLTGGGRGSVALADLDFTTASYQGATPTYSGGPGAAVNSAGNWTEFAANVMRRTDLGAVVEATPSPANRDGSIRNNSMQGAVAGTPGTLPTNWTATLNGLAFQVVGTGTTAGLEYIDIRLSGTATAGTQLIALEAGNVIAALQNETWARSTFIQLVGGSLTNISSVRLRTTTRTSGGAALTTTETNLGPTSTFRRVGATFTVTDATGAFLHPYIAVLNSLAAIDVTLRIARPQLEKGASVTSPIRTTNAAVTRAADQISLTIPAGVTRAVYTFDDDSQQTLSAAPGPATISAALGLNRSQIKRVQYFR